MIFIRDAEYSTTIFQRWPSKNAGGDNQLQLKYVTNSGVPDGFTRILVSQAINNSDRNHYSQEFCDYIAQVKDRLDENYDDYEDQSDFITTNFFLNLVLNVSHADLYDSQDIPIEFADVAQPWQAGPHLNGREIYHNQGASWTRRTTNADWEYTGAMSPTAVSTSTITYNRLYEPIYLNFDLSISNSQLDKVISFPTSIDDFPYQGIGTIYFYSARSSSPLKPRWMNGINDYTWTASSNQIDDIDNYIPTIMNMRPEFGRLQLVKFIVNLNTKVYSNTWTTSIWQNHTEINTTKDTDTMSWAISDITNLNHFYAIPHFEQKYTRVSCDGQKNYFYVDMGSLRVNRKYQMQLKIKGRTFKVGEPFKVV